ncbi:hypothetical protein PASE110613_01490 [Paenibacillus sediminis]|uniref:Uncharacterized protein n=1 Tax=Paenibacillus sediminis TaxID=664909 RepID=A0ABS4GZP6_9BACL|nr:hypothetical protein [Paenibacillus sediminis]MBP1935743.1 hypothetical protein [Paenibacillus sediminis]
MDTGLISLILFCVTVVLLLTGWKSILLPEVSFPVLILLFAGWFMMRPFELPLPGGHSLNGGMLVLLLPLPFILYSSTRYGRLLYLLSAMFFLSLYMLIHVWIVNHPEITMVSVERDLILVMASLTFFLISDLKQQYFTITFSLLGYEIFLSLAREGVNVHTFGGDQWMHQWWIMIVLTRLLTLVSAQFSLYIKKFVQPVSWLRRSERRKEE